MNLFFDIETATIQEPSKFSGKLLEIWNERVAKPGEDSIELYKEKWPIFAEYWQVVCISFWWIDKEWNLKIKSFYQNKETSEKKMLENFKKILDWMKNPYIIWHNSIWFDVPYLIKRYLVNWIELPTILRIWWVKPWDNRWRFMIWDTMQLWKTCGMMWSSLKLICELMWIPSPKEDMDWSQVNDNFWKQNYDDIAKYCERDVEATYLVWKRLIDLNIMPSF